MYCVLCGATRQAFYGTIHCTQGNSPQARAVAANLSQKLHQLKNKMSDALVERVAEDFVDVATPLKQMSDAALAPLGKPDWQLFAHMPDVFVSDNAHAIIHQSRDRNFTHD